MVQRQSQPVEFGQSTVALQGAQIGNARADADKFYDPASNGGDSSNLLSSLLNIVAPVAQNIGMAKMGVDREEAYLAGAAAAATGQVEEDLQASGLTANWKTAGFRDTATKLKAADQDAQMAVDMEDLKTKTPEQFAEYLAKRRQDITPDVEGMSLDARKAMFAQQLTTERAAIKEHGTKHGAWIVDQRTKAVRQQVSTSLATLGRAVKSTDAYAAATDSMFATVVGVYRDPSLPEKARNEMVVETLLAGLEGNHERLYLQARNMKVTVPKPGGGYEEAALLERLPMESQIKLTKAFEDSQQKTSVIRNADYSRNLAFMQASWADPAAIPTTYEQLEGMIEEGVQRNILNFDEATSLRKEWAKTSQKRDSAGPIADAWEVGDLQSLFNFGADDKAGAQAWLAKMQKAKMPIEAVMDTGFSLLSRNASPELSKILGNMHKGVVGQLGQENADGLQAAQTMNGTLKRLDAIVASGRGNSGVMAAFLGAFEPEEARKIQRFRAELERNPDARIAAAKTMQAEVDFAKAGPDTVRALSTKAATEDAKLLEGITTTGLFGTLMGKASQALEAVTLGLWTADPALKGTARKWMFEDPERAAKVVEGFRSEVQLEMQSERDVNPFGSATSRFELAVGRVSARTLELEHGTLTLPKMAPGQTVHDYFGVSKTVPIASIGKALDSSFKPKDSASRVIFSVKNGQLMMEEFGAKSSTTPLKSQIVDPKSMRNVIEAMDEKVQQEYQATNGAGVTKAGSDGYSVTYNGVSSVPDLKPADMLEFRKGLVEREGVLGSAKEIKSGATGKMVTVAGVGLTGSYLPKPGPDGKFSKKDLDAGFAKATNDAANAGYNLSIQTKLGPRSTLMFAEFAYHGGTAWHSQPYSAKFVGALVKKDKEAALAALKEHPLWRDSGSTRQQHYANLVTKALE